MGAVKRGAATVSVSHTHSRCLAWGCSGVLPWRWLLPGGAESQPIAWRKEPKVTVTARMKLETRRISLVSTAPQCFCAPGHPGGRSLGGRPGLPHLPGPVQMHSGPGRGRPCPAGLWGAHAKPRPVAGSGGTTSPVEKEHPLGRMCAGPRHPPLSLLGLAPSGPGSDAAATLPAAESWPFEASGVALATPEITQKPISRTPAQLGCTSPWWPRAGAPTRIFVHKHWLLADSVLGPHPLLPLR